AVRSGCRAAEGDHQGLEHLGERLGLGRHQIPQFLVNRYVPVLELKLLSKMLQSPLSISATTRVWAAVSTAPDGLAAMNAWIAAWRVKTLAWTVTWLACCVVGTGGDHTLPESVHPTPGSGVRPSISVHPCAVP